MTDKYILRGHEAVPVEDLLEWAREFEACDRIVKQEDVGPYWISTVFLGLDHNYMRACHPELEHRPLLFETMVFEGKIARLISLGDRTLTVHESLDCERCSTWDEAVAQHEAMVARLTRQMNG
jgi:hypothetical protein